MEHKPTNQRNEKEDFKERGYITFLYLVRACFGLCALRPLHGFAKLLNVPTNRHQRQSYDCNHGHNVHQPQHTFKVSEEMNEERNQFDEAIFTACTSLGQLMTTKEVNANTRTLLKISKFRNFLMNLGNEHTANN